MNTHANTFNLERTANIAEFPQASGKTIYEHWRPYDEVLMVEKKTDDLVLYSAKATLDGRFYLRPTGLTGAGNVYLEDSELSSDLYYFNHNEFNAELDKIKESAIFCSKLGIKCHAGHGLNYENVKNICKIEQIVELNVGHFIISNSIYIGLEETVKKFMKIINHSSEYI